MGSYYYRRFLSPEERFWSFVYAGDNGCLEWRGGKGSGTGDYGMFWSGGRSFPAHRFAYELAHGRIPDGHHVHHICHNPGCVNPDHLEVLSPKAHFAVRRYSTAWNKGIQMNHFEMTECPKGHRLNEGDVGVYRGRTYCRHCSRERVRRSRMGGGQKGGVAR